MTWLSLLPAFEILSRFFIASRKIPSVICALTTNEQILQYVAHQHKEENSSHLSKGQCIVVLRIAFNLSYMAESDKDDFRGNKENGTDEQRYGGLS